jgi:predicted peroxiredoxin
MSFEIDRAQKPFCFSLGTLIMNFAVIHFIMTDAQELLLSLNGFCFSTRRK